VIGLWSERRWLPKRPAHAIDRLLSSSTYRERSAASMGPRYLRPFGQRGAVGGSGGATALYTYTVLVHRCRRRDGGSCMLC
jgi:hypothetical protein